MERVCRNVQSLLAYVFVFLPKGINSSGAKEERITDRARLSVSFSRKEDSVPVQFRMYASVTLMESGKFEI